jgi:PAS domain-containing protein
VDKDGVILFHPDHPPGTIIESLQRRDPGFGDFLRSLTRGEEQQAEYVTESGRLVIAAATPVRVADQTWSVVTETREDAIRGILMRFNVQHLLANLIAVVMIIGSALGILRLVTRWNRQLKDEIAERARTEEELRFREESYRSLVENSPS